MTKQMILKSNRTILAKTIELHRIGIGWNEIAALLGVSLRYVIDVCVSR